MKKFYRWLLEKLDIVQISRVRDDFQDVFNRLEDQRRFTLVVVASFIDAVGKSNPDAANDLKVQWGELLRQTFTDADQPIVTKKDLN